MTSLSGQTLEGIFARLGLLPGADAREIRGAYARELKKIDQALDVAGFQQLREAYESALQFVAWHAVPAPAAPSAPAPQSGAIFDAFCERVTQLGAAHGDASGAPFVAALHAALDDERLFRIDARQEFGVGVAELLVQGWQPGHEALLDAAAAVFQWEGALRLAGMGYAGAVLECALVERSLFGRQPIVEKQAQRRVIRLLRQEALPERAAMAQDMPFFMRMQDCVPHWLAIVAPPARIAYWQALCPPPGMPEQRMPEKVSWLQRILMAGVCVAGLVGVDYLASRPPHPHPPFVVDAPAAPEVAGVPFTTARIDEIVARVENQLPRDALSTPLACEFQVLLDTGGRVAKVTLLSTSGNPRVDAAVYGALVASAPFPPETLRETTFTFRRAPR